MDAHPSIRQNWTFWVPFAFAAVPIIVAALRLFVLARGDYQIFVALLAGSTLSNVWISTAFAIALSLISMAPVAALLLWFAAGSQTAESMQRRAAWLEPFWRTLLILAVLSVLFSFLRWGTDLLPVLTSSIVLTSLCVFMARYFRSQVRAPDLAERLEEGLLSRFQLGIAAGVLSVLVLNSVFQSAPGVPPERLRIKGEGVLSDGYVVAVDDVSLSFLYLNGGIRKILNTQVEGRFVCPRASDDLTAGVQIVVNALSGNQPYRAPECSM